MTCQLAGTVPVDGGKERPRSSSRRSSTIFSSQTVSSTDSSEALSPLTLTSSSSPAYSVSLPSRPSRSTLEHFHRFSLLVPDSKYDEASISEAVRNVVKSPLRNHPKVYTSTQSDQQYYPMLSLTESGLRTSVLGPSDPTTSQRFPKRWSPPEHRRGDWSEFSSNAQENSYVLKSSPFPGAQSNSEGNVQFESCSVPRSAAPLSARQYYLLFGDSPVEGLPSTGDDGVLSFLHADSTPRCSLADTTNLSSLFKREDTANDGRSYSYPLAVSEEPNSVYALGMDDEMESLVMQPRTKDKVANPEEIEKPSRQSRALLSDSNSMLLTQPGPCHTQTSDDVLVPNAVSITAAQSGNYSHMQNIHCYPDWGVMLDSDSGIFCKELESHDLVDNSSEGHIPQPVSACIDSEDSVFDDGTSCSADDDLLDVSSFSEGYSQNVVTLGDSSVSGTSNSFSTELSPYTSFSASGTPGNTGWDQNGAHPRQGQGRSLTPKSATSNGKPASSQRVLRRLRCHFNAQNPHKYCVNTSTGDRYHTCAKSGSLNIQHLIAHLRKPHAVPQVYDCQRCGDGFKTPELRDEHLRLDQSQMCTVRDDLLWPGTIQAEGINDFIEERIKKFRKPAFQKRLSDDTQVALNSWIRANVTEYVGTNFTKQDELELRNWYLIWLALFPGVGIPLHPFFDATAPSSVDGKFIQVFQELAEDKIGRGEMQPIAAELMNEILSCLRETQSLMFDVSPNAQSLRRRATTRTDPVASWQNNVRTPEAWEALRSGPSAVYADPRTPRSHMRPPPKRKRDDSDGIVSPTSNAIADSPGTPTPSQRIRQLNPVLPEPDSGSQALNPARSSPEPVLQDKIDPTLLEPCPVYGNAFTSQNGIQGNITQQPINDVLANFDGSSSSVVQPQLDDVSYPEDSTEGFNDNNEDFSTFLKWGISEDDLGTDSHEQD